MSYQVELPGQAGPTEAEKLVDYKCYYLINSGGQTYVQIKYYLVDVIELHNISIIFHWLGSYIVIEWVLVILV